MPWRSQSLFQCYTTDFYRPRTKYEGRYCFHRCLSVRISGEYPIQRMAGGGVFTPSQVQTGVPHPRSRQGGGTPTHTSRTRWGIPPLQDWVGYPHPPPQSGDSSISSTCYAAGGMPLAFTQEDFLVANLFSAQFTSNWWQIQTQNKT